MRRLVPQASQGRNSPVFEAQVNSCVLVSFSSFASWDDKPTGRVAATLGTIRQGQRPSLHIGTDCLSDEEFTNLPIVKRMYFSARLYSLTLMFLMSAKGQCMCLSRLCENHSLAGKLASGQSIHSISTRLKLRNGYEKTRQIIN